MGGLRGACFKIIATYTTSFPLTHIKAREKLTPSICLSSVTGEDGAFAFKGYNAEVKSPYLCPSGHPHEWRTTTPQYCYGIEQINLSF